MFLKVFSFFIIASSLISRSFGLECYSCKSTPSDYDNDCYSGHANVSTNTCNYCWSIVKNNFNGSFNVERDCSNYSVSSKDVPLGKWTRYCQTDLCNDHTPHLEIPDVKCYLCTSTPANFDEECYYGKSNVLTTTCEGDCTAVILNNFDGTFNVTRDCYRYSQRKSNKIKWWQYTFTCSTDFCNNDSPHVEQQTSSTTPSSSSFASGGRQDAWLFLQTFFFWLIAAYIF